MASGRINPITGRRLDWEAQQAAAKAQDPKLIEKQIGLLQRQQRALLARDDLLTFTEFTMPDPTSPNDIDKSRYQAAKFHKAIAKHLEEMERGEFRQLILTLPPRAGKTEIATKRFTAWFAGRNPYESVAISTYSDTMAEDYGADIRSIMNSAQFRQVFPNFGLMKGGQSKSNIQTTKGGRIVCVGVGGALTGRGAGLLIVDDPVKNAEDARSQTMRDAAWDWFTKVAMTRRMGKKLVLIIMTRWHSDDIVGRLTDPTNDHFDHLEAKSWKIINIPAIAEENDPLGRQPGEPLWPERYDLEFLAQQQRLDPLGFAALYQQRPTVADGTLFRRENIQRYDPKDLPENLRFYAASDHAVGTKQRNDPSCFGKAGVDQQNNLWFTELFWERVPADRAVEQMLSMGTGPDAPLIWWAESGHISKSIGPFLNKRMVETDRYVTVREIVPSADKQTRAQSMAARVAVGKVFFPKGAIWDKAVEEMLAFPNGTHDDFVDMLSLFGIGLQSQFGASTPKAPKSEPKFGTAAWLKQNDKWAETKRREAAGGGF